MNALPEAVKIVLYTLLMLPLAAIVVLWARGDRRSLEAEKARINRTRIVDYQSRGAKAIATFEVHYNTGAVRKKYVEVGSARHQMYVELLEENMYSPVG